MYQVCASIRMLGPNAGLFITLVSPSFPITDLAERASVARIVHELDTPPKNLVMQFVKVPSYRRVSKLTAK